MAHGHELLQAGHGVRARAEPHLVPEEPEVLILGKIPERPLGPVLAAEHERGPRDVLLDRGTDLPAGDVEEEERPQERERRTAGRPPARQHRVDHRLEETRGVPVVVIHLLAERPAREGHAAVQLGPERGAGLDAHQPSAQRLDRGGVGRVLCAVVHDHELAARVRLVPVAGERDREEPRPIPGCQDDRHEWRTGRVARRPRPTADG